ncbi:hypothetical protein P280DRAFT_286912 [Massarina eburnea CBS 473.64]|uniref:Uncharacterized protein n=1 Tax=Massarina eburnea CBS 473.64 TaxID=1395130 RepID=A0A6A6S3J3_9PLEO|nr:hypothetical protein P280DRAFT_286912 [Massarina eburnea CBS 473.64]
MSNPEEVDQFMQRMRTMSDQKDRQDDERVKKLEEEIIQGRSERLARRAERARSLSPDKPTTPQPAELSSQTGSPAQVLDDEEPKKPAPSAAALGRSGTLSWQRRPQSSSSPRRPLSLASPPLLSPEHSPEAEPSRDQIAQSLAAKDPSWFKQTADRGIGSRAYRKDQDDGADAGSVSAKRQLPGMSPEPAAEPAAEPVATSPPAESGGHSTGSKRGSAMLNRLSATSTPAGDDAALRAKSPLPVLESQKFAPPSEAGSSVDGGDRTSMRGLAMSPTQGRMSPERERPASPTKGMGGFVQSAILKRSDSVSKRWSAQTPPTVSRRGSTYGTVPKAEVRPSTLSRDNSEPSSRPASSAHKGLSITTKDAGEGAPKPEFAKPAPSRHSRSKSVASTFSNSERQQDEAAQHSPASPHKRWSPTKSSWLESALSKPPESPKIKKAPTQQPAWMSELSRIKQQRGSVDFTKGSPFQSPTQSPRNELPPSGRKSPIKDVQLKPIGLRRPESPKKELPEPEKATKPAQTSPKPKPAISPKPAVIDEPEPSPAEESTVPKDDADPPKVEPAAASANPPAATDPLPKDPTPSSPAKPKSDATPKNDFRANLKSRGTISDGSKGNEVSELQSVFGKLKRTETKNYVAPDTLKDNILRGKSGLAITGGPKPTVRKDEFRQSLISQKSAMLAKAQEAGSAAHKRADSSSKPTPTPEALSIRKNLGRSESISKVPPPKEKEKEATPEALARIQALRASKSAAVDKPAQPAEPIALKEPVVSNKLAGRFNPALAGLLARGPPPMATDSGASGGGGDDSAPGSITEEKPKPGPELTHMTKGRARGPKRRTPAASKQTATEEEKPSEETPEKMVEEKVTTPDELEKAEHVLPTAALHSFKANNAPEEPPRNRTPSGDSLKAKPVTPAKSPDLPKKLENSSSPELPKKPTPFELARRISSEAAAKKSPVPTPTASPNPSPSPSPPIVKKSPVPTPAESPKHSPSSSPPLVKKSPVTTPAEISKPSPSPSPPLVKKSPVPAPAEISKPSPSPSPPLVKKSPVPAPAEISKPSPSPSPLLLKKSPVPTPAEISKPSPSPSPLLLRKSPVPAPAEISKPSPSPSPPLAKKSPVPTPAESPKASPSPPLVTKSPVETPERSPSLGPWFGQITPLKVSKPLPTPNESESKALQESKPLPTPPAKPERKVFRESKPLPTPPTKSEQETFPPNGDFSPSKDESSSEISVFSVKDRTASWGRQPSTSPSSPKSPIKLPTRADEQAAMEDAGLVRTPPPAETVQSKPQAPKGKPFGLSLGGLNLGGLASKSRDSTPPKPLSAKLPPNSPPMSNDRPLSEPLKASPAPDKPQGVFDEFFDEKPITTGQLSENIDTLHILQHPPFDFGPAGKIRTLRKTLQEVTGDGKLLPVPAQVEHILYADSMYLCAHAFTDSKGANATEVYLWSGQGVPEPTVEDVQIFARNFAKQNQGKLVHMRQGKETPNFFEALGGIVLTKRARPSSKEMMLCGRRHLGHIAFDEVEFSPKSLCSGYPYIISTDSGKVYIWKGRGCSQEELAASRLMGMDLNPTGDFVEIAEGYEMQDFLNVFPASLIPMKGPVIPRSADHWRYKATSDRYRSRLFKVEQHQNSGWGSSLQVSSYLPAMLRRPSWGNANAKDKAEQLAQAPASPAMTTKVVEVMPFCQRDLEPEYIYVLDAFFETYIIVGALSRTQNHAFATALMFAQEYTMLAVSEEDRPFMPISTIVLEGTPRDMKQVFRFWDDAMIPAAGLIRGKLGRGKSLRIVGLEKAIEATRQ